jgi:hypothetical protein
LPGDVKKSDWREYDETKRLDIHYFFLGYNFRAGGLLFYKGIFKKGVKMKRKVLFSFLIPFILLGLSGCAAPLIVGGAAGALGACAISKDTIEGDSDKAYESLWDAAMNIAHARGTIKEGNEQRGYIELETDSSKVYIRLIRLTRLTTRIRVSARNKYHLPNLNLAEDMFVKIMEMSR